MIYKSLGLAIVSTLPYLFSLRGDFVFDDSEAIIKNKDVVSKSWSELFSHDFWGTNIRSNLSHKSYRPLTIISFRLNYIGNSNSLSATQFKVTNLICHIICCFLVWNTFVTLVKAARKTIKISRGIDIPYYAALLFATHPIHTEAVCGIVGRADILAAITFFLAFLSYNHAVKLDNYKFLISTVILANLSMLFKENGLTVLGFCIIYDLVINLKAKHKHQTNKGYKLNIHANCVKRILILLLSTICLLYLRWFAMAFMKPEFKPIDNPASFSDNFLTKITTYNYVYFLNLLLLMWPQWLCYDWSMGCIQLVQVLDFRVLTILAIYIYGILFLSMLMKRAYKRPIKRLSLLAVSLAVIPFLPASNILYPVGFVVAERVLYISSAGYCLLVSIGIHKISCIEKKKKIKISKRLFYVLILIYALRTWQRSFDWQTEYKLFVSGLSVCPNNAKIHYNVAKVADLKQQTNWALAEYREAIRLYPDYYQAMNNLANMLKDRQYYEEAERYLTKAVRLKPDFSAAWMNLGIVLANVKRYNESLDAYNKALEHRRNYPDCLYNLGNLFLEMEEFTEAVRCWSRATELNPKHELAWTNLLALLDNTNQLQKAAELIPYAVLELPQSASVAFAVANVYGKLERYDEAEEHFKKSIRLFDKKVQALHYSNLGVLYHRWKKYSLAKEMYEKALVIQPSFQSAQKNLNALKRYVK